ncbi:hypothetical protein [Mesorhizobium captivum]|uniref:hypothetical protein n=1 Tax=Mesorhizobium captivum TaxID=3072319 RepID=UPI002A24C4C0|nr:hypothetical protein [Mesorhizobium sp. VK22E]MDX8508866.1 hypothetical protein [Mesorhizobium sp. VK22E]
MTKAGAWQSTLAQPTSRRREGPSPSRLRRATSPHFVGRGTSASPQLPKSQNIAIYPAMEELFGDPAYKGFVLQDRKRLPSRFAARVCGALTSRLSLAV